MDLCITVAGSKYIHVHHSSSVHSLCFITEFVRYYCNIYL